MNNKTFCKASIATLLLRQTSAALAQTPPAGNNDQVVIPQVDRRDIEKPKFPSNDFEIGLFTGTYATQNFGSSWVYGARIGYAITEDFFVEGVYGQTKVSDELFRQILPSRCWWRAPRSSPTTTCRSATTSFPARSSSAAGERGPRSSISSPASAAPVGRPEEDRPSTLGFGYRLYLADWVAFQLDLRDHIFSLDLLGKREHPERRVHRRPHLLLLSVSS